MSQRRTTLQLNNVGSKNSSAQAAAPLVGLVGQYGDSDSESEETHYQETNASKPCVNGSETVRNPIDSQLASFMAEIEAIDEQSPPQQKEPDISELKKDLIEKAKKSRSVKMGGMMFVSGGTTHSDGNRKISNPKDSTDESCLEKPEEPVTPWQHCLDEGTQHYYYWNTQNNEVRWDIPAEYSQYLLQYKAYEDAMSVFQAKLTELGDKAKIKSHKEKLSKLPVTETKTEVIGPQLPPAPKAPEPTETTIKKPIGSDLPTDVTEPPHTITEQTDKIQGEEDTKIAQKDESTKMENSDGSIDDDEIYKKLEEPVLFEYENIIRKNKLDTQPPPPPPPAPQPDDSADELDDIDKQLDMALEKEQKITETKDSHKKRKAFQAVEETPNTKLRRIGQLGDSPEGDEEAISYIKRKLLKNKEQLKLKTVIADLATLVIDKLEFLEITRKGLSKLQILLIELQTRIHDWKEGGLDTHYLHGKLKDASKQLEQYETSAAPPGWACQWDRMFKRYFYCHKATGESRWEYPDEDDDGSAIPNQIPPSIPQEIVVQDETENKVSDEVQSLGCNPTEETAVESLDGQPLDSVNESPTEQAEANIDGSPLDEYSLEPPPPGTEPQGPLPSNVPPPLPPETYSDCESNASQEEEVSPEPPVEYTDMAVSNMNTNVATPVESTDDGENGDMHIASEDIDGVEMEIEESPYVDIIQETNDVVTAETVEETSASNQLSQPTIKEKKKRKEKSKKQSLSMKKKNFPSMVEKWKHAQEDMEQQMRQRKQAEQEAEAYAERMVEKWKQEEREKLGENTGT